MTNPYVPPTQTGKNFLITGANTGIGLATARTLLRHGARVFIACRSLPTAERAASQLRVETGFTPDVLQLDLSDFDSVRACAARFASQSLPLHVLLNNAGVAGMRARTRSGFELAFGVNHLGHFLLTQLLLPQLRAAGQARVVTVASKAHYDARGFHWDDLQKKTRGITGIQAYAVSKLANVLFSAELGRRLAGSGISSYSLHPGVIASDVWRHVPQPARWLLTRRMIDVDEGSWTSLYCATAPEAASASGLYYDHQAIKEPSKLAQDTALAKELWQRSESWTK
jgi:retinol dehydrogenase-12